MAPRRVKKARQLKDLKVSEEKVKKVKGGFNPQPEPPGNVLNQSTSQTITPTTIANKSRLL